MSGQAQPEVDYNALAQQARSQTASKPVTKKSAQPAVDYDALASQARQTSAPAASAQSDLTFNTKGEGLYRMGSYDFNQGQVTKPEIQVPYSRVQDAIAAGYNLHPDEAPRYQKDSTHEGQGPTAFEHVKSLLSRMTEPMPDTPLQGSPFQQAAAAMGNVAKLPANVVSRTLRGVAGLPQGVTQTVTGISQGDPAALESLNPATMGENATRGLSEDTSNLGPMAALGNFGGDAATMYLAGEYGPKVVESTTKPVVSAAKSVYGAPETVARFMTDTGHGPVERLVKDTQAENKVTTGVNEDRIVKQQKDQAQADADYRSDLLKLKQKYEQDVRDATEKARTGTAEDRAQLQAKQLAAKQKYDQAVRNQTEKFHTARAEAQRANAESQRQYNQSIGKTVQQNRATTTAEQAKSTQAARLQVGGSQLIYRLNKLDSALRDRASMMYDAIREKVGNVSLPGTDLAQAARAALSKISGTSVTPTVFRDILGKYPEAEPEFIDYQGTPIPKTNRLYDVLKQQGVDQAPPVTFADLQGYYSELGSELSRGTLPGDVYQATRALQESIGDLMQKQADSVGAGKQLATARKFYREYMDTFHEPTGPSGSGSPVAQALLAKDPLTAVDKFTGDAGDRGIAVLRRYSPDLANLAQDIRQTAQTKVSAPARKSIAEITQPTVKPIPAGASLPLPGVLEPALSPRASNLPLPPVLPEGKTVPVDLKPLRTISTGDITAARQAAAEASAGKWWRRGEWAAAVPIFQAMRGFWGGHIPSLPIIGLESAGVLATSRAAAEFLRYPPMIRFLTQARPEDIALIPADMRGDLPGLVSQAQRYGIKVSPPLAAVAAGATNQPGDRQTFTPDQAIQAMQPVLAGATQ